MIIASIQPLNEFNDPDYTLIDKRYPGMIEKLIECLSGPEPRLVRQCRQLGILPGDQYHLIQASIDKFTTDKQKIK